MTYVRPGQPVTVTVDTYPDTQWHGTVESISPAAAQEFSLLPAQNTSGNWVKVVQRIPMRVRVDTSDSEPAAAARRDERRGRCRHRPCAGLAALPGRTVRSRPAGAVMPAERAPAGGNRAAITVCVILATLMQALDTTIANVALPYMQGSVSASQDQIAWVLTSYIVAAAIMTPPTGYLAGRFGLKRLFLVSVAGFTVASMLCGMAQSLVEIVLFRVLQGMFGAALVPLSQTVLLNINPKERQGSAMALWGVAVMAGPVLGPVLGGWLTEAYSWRYVFYINLPIGVLAFLGMIDFPARDGTECHGEAGLVRLRHPEPGDRRHAGRCSTAASSSTGSAPARSSSRPSSPPRRFYLFLVHTFTAREPFVRPSLFRDRNFAAGTLFIAIVGLTYYASLALQPPYLQNLMNYPIVSAGLVMGPRGVGTMGAMLVVGKLIGRVDTRFLLGIGLGLTAWSFYAMTGWTPDVSQTTIIVVGVIQGIGLGFIFVPLSVGHPVDAVVPSCGRKAPVSTACRATSARASASRW